MVSAAPGVQHFRLRTDAHLDTLLTGTAEGM